MATILSTLSFGALVTLLIEINPLFPETLPFSFFIFIFLLLFYILDVKVRRILEIESKDL
ncbi:hypothetical protein ACJRO7_020385 [Eucalyptus globulus]|uniref:Uncharacterized protein n=1 Tax=Eucalyptus globulus TaxID=34317 RepID=A0ABD3KLD7_EUCGL